MKTQKTRPQFILFALLLLLSACDKDDGPSSERKILNFKFENLDAGVIATISQNNRTVDFFVPNATDVTALIPIIQISANATISPAAGEPQDFTHPVTYRVISEDRTIADYVVTITKDTKVDFSVNPFTGSLRLIPDSLFSITGTNFGNNHITNGIEIISIKDLKNAVKLPAVAENSNNETLTVLLPKDLKVFEEYKVKVWIGLQSKVLDEIFVAGTRTPIITGVSKSSIAIGETFDISGYYFGQENCVVTIRKDKSSTDFLALKKISATDNLATVILDMNIADGDYFLSISNFYARGFYTETIHISNPPLPTPEITSIDKISYSRGETITLTGKYLGKIGVYPSIVFTSYDIPLRIARQAIPNSNGTQCTYIIPQDFPLGSFHIEVYVDGKMSQMYSQQIEIKL
jgi:hypothetical protein